MLMTYFDTILKNHQKKVCPQYLWQLKVTDQEYAELRRLLIEKAGTYCRNCSNRFITVTRECTLYMAEFWRREYTCGAHGVQIVLDSLGLSERLYREFYDAACHGAKRLRIEKYDGGRKDPLNDMFYQGGLPMKLIAGKETGGVWERFTRGLVNRRISFDELNLGLVASQSRSMKVFCEEIIRGIETNNYLLMPFYCEDENNSWFHYLKELAKEERKRRRQLHPYSLYWEFDVDNVERKIKINYVVEGMHCLPQAFLEAQNLQDTPFFSVQIRKNGLAGDTFDYTNNFCRYEVVSRHLYTEGDHISLFLHNQENPYLSDYLDMHVPHLLYKNANGMFVPGNEMGRQESLLLIPEGWEVENASRYMIQQYTWGKTQLSGIRIASDETSDIVVKGEDGAITFGTNATLYWTEMQSHPVYLPDVIEPVYNAGKCFYKMCHDVEDGMEIKRCAVQYRNKWQQEWSDKPSYGEIYARAVSPDEKYVTPIRFINIGEGLRINLINADKDSCLIKVSWPHGQVTTTEGEKKVNDVWEIKKENCADPRRIKFTLIPEENSRNQFTLSVKAPFRDFSIVDTKGENITDGCWIPYSDIDRYQYHLVGKNIRKYTFGNIRRELRWIDGLLYIMENGHTLKQIPYEGSLLTLFGSREMLRSMLEQTSQSMIHAEIKVQFTLSDEEAVNFYIKESPFRPRQLSDGRVVITDNNRKPVKFMNTLRLLKLNEPELAPIEISPDGDSIYYTLPEEIRPWGKTLLIGRTRGRICPALVDLTREMDGAYRINNRETAILTINENLQKSVIGDELWQRILGWFRRSQKDDIPASSILELYCTAQNYRTLLCLAFQLFIKTPKEDDRMLLKEQLKSFSNDLAFQWYWLQPYLNKVFSLLYSFMGDPMAPAMQEIYIYWAMKQPEAIKYLTELNKPEAYIENITSCLQDVFAEYTQWMYDLCVASLTETYDLPTQGIAFQTAETLVKNPDRICRIEVKGTHYVETNQDLLDSQIENFFLPFEKSGTTGNEQWLYKRVNAVAAHLKGEIDLFEKVNDFAAKLNRGTDIFATADEIRRSIIFCCKSTNQHFITLLNNQLVR